MDKEQWIDALGRSTDKPRMECCEDQKGTIIDIRASQGHSHCVSVNPTLFILTKIPLNWKEHIFHTGSSSNVKSILENGLWAGGLESEKHETSLFLLTSKSAGFVIKTADDRLDRTSS